MIEILSALLSNGVLGSGIGVLGSYLTRRQEISTLKLQNEHDLKLTTLNLQHELSIADKNLKQTFTEGQIAQEIKETDAFIESMQVNKRSFGGIADMIIGFTRPVLTMLVIILVAYIFYNVNLLVNGLQSLSQKDLLDLYRQMILDIVFLANVAVGWWFGSRPTGKR
jgi:hypothetical protein